MKAYDAMVALKKKESADKTAAAKEEIARRARRGESLSIAALVRATGFSRSFFYSNEEVRDVLEKVRERQGAGRRGRPKGEVLNRTLLKENERLKRETKKLKEENDSLRNRISRQDAEFWESR